MKRLVAVLMICVAMACFAEDAKEVDEKATWSEDFAACLEKAKKSHKPIFALFTGSDWCIWCKRLEGEVLSKEPFLKYAGRKLILFKADFPSKIQQDDNLKSQNQNLAKKYGIRGYPTVLLLDKKGEIIGKTGYKQGGPDKYVKHIKELIKDGK
ncbi:MAG: thioredoxin family protein [Victivallales bacterium]|nr:thioredoxin family protein [Victivallales bacterium]